MVLDALRDFYNNRLDQARQAIAASRSQHQLAGVEAVGPVAADRVGADVAALASWTGDLAGEVLVGGAPMACRTVWSSASACSRGASQCEVPYRLRVKQV